jgi:hydroxymethylpyrimidine/phosphomethylpyrimidine kinase
VVKKQDDAMKRYRRVLTIAGSDSGGGAGIQADIKTISACGCYAASAITAVTVQNTLGVKAVHAIPVEVITQQIEAVIEDIGVDAVKIGMLHSAEVADAVARVLQKFGVQNIVLDPVMVSTSGHRLIEENAIESLVSGLMPMSRVITPNIPEAEILLGGAKLDRQSDLKDAARALAERCGTSVLLKAGHLTENKLVDIFYNAEEGEVVELPSVRIETRNTHGTGCTMSSAFASMLAKGYSLTESAKMAKDYINSAIIAGADYEIGHGFGPVNHFYKFNM